MTAIRKNPKRKILHPHQRTAFAYTMQEQHPALFMEMRLGKTLVTIRRCKMYSKSPRILVFAPNAALNSWKTEATSEACTSINLSGYNTKYVNSMMDTVFTEDVSSAIFVLLNKEAWLRKGLVELANYPWDAIILDESTFIKSPKAKVTGYFLQRFRDVPHRWILTGTPWPNSEDEVYTQMKFLGHDLLGANNYWTFRNAHMTQYPYGGWGVRGKSREKIQKEVGERALIMRRKDIQMAEQKVRVERQLVFPENVRKIYEKAEEEFILDIPDMGKIETVWAVTRYQWLRQLCSGMCPKESGVLWDGKLKELDELSKGELAGERIVVWCNYNSEVAAIEQYFDSRDVWALTGKVNPKERWKHICSWEKHRGGILVLQQRIAQMGMDLSAADTAIYFSSPVEPLARAQTEDRIVSMEKIKQGIPLLIMDLVVKNSVDEDVLRLLSRKRNNADISLSQALIHFMKKRRELWGK